MTQTGIHGTLESELDCHCIAPHLDKDFWNSCIFRSPQSFARFCALGNVDPDVNICGPGSATLLTYTWISRGKDLTFQLTADADALVNIPSGPITITGVADKVKKMYEFVRQGNAEWYQLSPGLDI